MTDEQAPDALRAEVAEAKGTAATFEAFGQLWVVQHKPNPLLLAEMARTESQGSEAIAVIADFFQYTLGDEQYGRFKYAFYDSWDDEEGLVGELMGRVMEVAFGRPFG